ncbi:hypothetical protein VITU102760_14955 [Vibrio tubiashii]|uniref:Uncharacterized protein n=1 Tax=Vibrio tubiashii ATCC 19109 TaxID=1051646 RepID=F9T4G1_9VIBR|nr:hypothetical protein [Vibrio tubiashii]AIW13314.1 hypothetical protein IX91_03720 [Vibrio tubiashii ATCC 19109]EGU56072.1 hypothetical protein VITU9109_08927 [Vibrio tubiashii ATCC 19109]EIF04284.1 hypothetical protein VT1337_09142 [Vibrio tubiashii NCIMB 1337 = ATCC 19106]
MTIAKSSFGQSSQLSLFPLPYFSISQAAEQIGVSEDYIRYAIKCGLVRPCICFDDIGPQHTYSAVCSDNKILDNIEIFSSSDQLSHDAMFGSSQFTRPLSSNIDHLLSTSMSQLNATDYQELENGEGIVEGYLFGFWQVSEIEIAVQLMSSEEMLNIEVVPFVDNGWYQEQVFDKEMIRVAGFSVDVKAESIVLSHCDVKCLKEAYLKGTPINKPNFYGRPVQPKVSINREAKPSQKMAAVIAALIATNPKLGKDIFSSKVSLAEVLEQHFASEGISLGSYFPHESTIRRWFQGEDIRECIRRFGK